MVHCLCNYDSQINAYEKKRLHHKFFVDKILANLKVYKNAKQRMLLFSWWLIYIFYLILRTAGEGNRSPP